ncbi:MAG: aldehyde dehydrogenase family protein [Thermodesulfobacteriota bacterium]
MNIRDSVYMDGKWRKPSGNEWLEVENPCTETVVGRVAMGNTADVDTAVTAAGRAFESWSTTSVEEREDFLLRIAEALAERQDEIGDTIAGEMGMPVTWARMLQAGLPIAAFNSFARIIKDYPFAYGADSTHIRREPIGVCGFITPWNYPLHQIAGKVAPAIAAGCTMVLKPSQLAPLNAFLLAEIMEAVGLPPGVFNLVCGSGNEVGQALAAHAGVDMISLTGSTASGVKVARTAAGTVKRVTLELGGKSANILLPDADFEVAVPEGINACFLNSGQTCSALTRMLVPRDRQAEAIEMAVAETETLVMGDSSDEDAFLGPLVSRDQRESVREYIRRGIEEGARLVLGGPEPPAGFVTGYYVRPTIFADVRPEMTIAREEIFGPVLAIIPYDTEEQAVRIANDSIYGLSGAVWSTDLDKARSVAAKLRTGQVFLNGAGFDVYAPFGGYRQSGNGRERSRYGLEEFLEIKAIMGYNP